jgi:DNA-binding response OmpR family regulator
MVAWPLDAEPLSPSVLITDDSDPWREAVEEILARAGFHTLQATCGEEAIEVVHTEWIDIVLIDFHMPRLDGIQTLRVIRAEGHWQPAVMMTARPEAVPEDEVQALRIESVLAKPADRERIVTTVTRVVRRTEEPPR